MAENRFIISLGSNIDPLLHIRQALEKLKVHFNIIGISSLQTTKPIGITDQPDFVNGAVLATGIYTSVQVNVMLKKIENEMGRDRTVPKYGPRNIDLDLLIWNDEVIDEDYHSRSFLQDAVEELNQMNR